MMDIILYLYNRSKALVTLGHPVSVLKKNDIFERVISIKYDVPNNRLELLDDYYKDIDKFYENIIETN